MQSSTVLPQLIKCWVWVEDLCGCISHPASNCTQFPYCTLRMVMHTTGWPRNNTWPANDIISGRPCPDWNLSWGWLCTPAHTQQQQTCRRKQRIGQDTLTTCTQQCAPCKHFDENGWAGMCYEYHLGIRLCNTIELHRPPALCWLLVPARLLLGRRGTCTGVVLKHPILAVGCTCLYRAGD